MTASWGSPLMISTLNRFSWNMASASSRVTTTRWNLAFSLTSCRQERVALHGWRRLEEGLRRQEEGLVLDQLQAEEKITLGQLHAECRLLRLTHLIRAVQTARPAVLVTKTLAKLPAEVSGP